MKSAIEVEIDDVVKSAKSLFKDWISKGTRIAPNIRNIVYMAGKRNTTFIGNICNIINYGNKAMQMYL